MGNSVSEAYPPPFENPPPPNERIEDEEDLDEEEYELPPEDQEDPPEDQPCQPPELVEELVTPLQAPVSASRKRTMISGMPK